MRPALLIVCSVLLGLAHLEAVHNAYQDGRKDALSLKQPISEDLEFACVSLWVGRQNEIYDQKNPTTGVGPNTPKETRL